MKGILLMLTLTGTALLAQQRCKLRIYTEINNYYLYIDNQLLGKKI